MSKRKNYDPKKLIRQKVIGLTIHWSDTNPDMDSSGFMPGDVTHTKPLLRLLAGPLYANNKSWIVEQETFFWKVTMTGVFKYPNGKNQRETRELYAHIILADISTACEAEHDDILKHGNKEHYSHTEFSVECLAHQPIHIDEEPDLIPYSL